MPSHPHQAKVQPREVSTHVKEEVTPFNAAFTNQPSKRQHERLIPVLVLLRLKQQWGGDQASVSQVSTCVNRVQSVLTGWSALSLPYRPGVRRSTPVLWPPASAAACPSRSRTRRLLVATGEWRGRTSSLQMLQSTPKARADCSCWARAVQCQDRQLLWLQWPTATRWIGQLSEAMIGNYGSYHHLLLIFEEFLYNNLGNLKIVECTLAWNEYRVTSQDSTQKWKETNQ